MKSAGADSVDIHLANVTEVRDLASKRAREREKIAVAVAAKVQRTTRSTFASALCSYLKA